VFARAAESDEGILAVTEEAILHPVDCEKGEGIEIAKRYNVRGYPTFKMVNSEGKEIERWIGYEGPAKWVASARAGLADQRTLAEKAAAYETEPTLALAKSLANAASTEYDFKGAVAYFRKARSLDPNPMAAAEYTEGILTNMFYGTRMGQFEFAEVDAEAMPVMEHPVAPADAKLNIASMMTMLAKSTDNADKAVPYLKKAHSLTIDNTDPAVVEAWSELAVDHALLVTKDKDAAVELKRKSMDEGWREDADQLNNFAWWCFENGVNLEEAEELALRGIELATSDGQRANILDTAAEIGNARGKCEEAIARIRRAIALNPDKEYFQKQLVRFEEILKEKQG
jgi:tetratricopeptide (TPR) repeat protein